MELCINQGNIRQLDLEKNIILSCALQGGQNMNHILGMLLGVHEYIYMFKYICDIKVTQPLETNFLISCCKTLS